MKKVNDKPTRRVKPERPVRREANARPAATRPFPGRAEHDQPEVRAVRALRRKFIKPNKPDQDGCSKYFLMVLAIVVIATFIMTV